MPVPKPTRTDRVRISLPPAGIALLIFTGTNHEVSIPNPDQGRPGVRPRQVEGNPDEVLIEAIGYETPQEAHTAVARAAQACIDAGLVTSNPPTGTSDYPARIVRRKS